MLILVGSLMLNMFVFGVLATRYALTGRLLPSGQLAEGYLDTYPAPIRDTLKTELRERRQSLREIVGDLRKARADVHEIFRAQTLDTSAARAAMQRVRTQTDALIHLLQEALLESVDRAPYDVRQRISDPGLRSPIMRELGTATGSTDGRP